LHHHRAGAEGDVGGRSPGVREPAQFSDRTLSRTRQTIVLPLLPYPPHGSRMRSKSEELLYLLLWACDMVRRPTFRNLTDSN
jgi:hypothetical protein